MARISEIVDKVYQKYAPIVKSHGISLDFDFPDTTLTIRDHERVARDLDKSLRSAVNRSKGGRISVTIRPGAVIVADDGTILSKDACDLLSSEHIKVKSRVGFGTRVEIS